MSTKYPKGAEWRKWDLHVHTPFSIYQKYGENNAETWEKFIFDLESLPEEFSVVGINDYLFLDGYQKLRNEQHDNGRLHNLIFLPVVEFRIEKFAGVEFGKLKRINLHVIFSNELPVETIKSQFLNTLEQSYTLESGEKWIRAITLESVAELGATIKSAVPKEKLSEYGTDLTEGFNNLNVNETQIFKSLQKDCFKDKYLIAIGKTEWAELKWTDSSIATKKTIINSAHIVFTSAGSIEAFEKSKSQLTKQGVNDLLLDCSDAHDFSESVDKDRIGKCFTWLKADTTFDGLRQVVIEPDERIFVGERPHLFDRISKNRTKYIKELIVTQENGYDERYGVWFKDVFIPLNSELVAIIGNKGSGKSAIADVLSLCSNYLPDQDFSFLTPEKFKKRKLAESFIASITWESGKISSVNLNAEPDSTNLLDVKYIPQGQFERLTNEIRTVEEFQREIESVVFSHIPDAEKLGTRSFDELILKTTSSVNLALDGHKKDAREINKKIIALEKKATSEYKAEIENKLKKKQEELDALVEPSPVPDPNNDPKKKLLSEEVNNKINALKEDIRNLQDDLQKAEDEKKSALESLQKLKNIKADIQQKELELGKYISGKKLELAEFDVDLNKLIIIRVDFTELNVLITDKENCLKKAKEKLGEIPSSETTKPLSVKLEEKEEQLKAEKSKLDAEQQQYQRYLAGKDVWQKERSAIVGSFDLFDTLEYYKHELVYLGSNLSSELEGQYEARRNITRNIFDKKQEVISVYKEARNRLSAIISENQKTLKDYKIEVDASLVMKTDFRAKFLSHILQNIKGTFLSKDGGEKQLIKMLADIDFDKKDDVISLLDNLVDALRYDKRDGLNNAQRTVFAQVKDISDLYDYLFSLEFLVNNYQLKQGDKELEQLSPGERGALLLVFYLLLDKNDMPLVIDQPEDNLDNHSVATILVPFIRAAKKKRQIVMVTHNPNLAVVADAEQVIYVNLGKETNYTFSTVSGSIEDKDVNQKIVDVLEGAMPAFNMRKRKYYE